MKLVVVDNSVLVKKLLVGLLSKLLPKCKIEFFEKGEDAIEYFKGHFEKEDKENIILFQDIHMPEPNGVDIIKFIRKEEAQKSIKDFVYIVACSAYGDKETIIPSIMSGSNAFFKKKISIDCLREELEKVRFNDNTSVLLS